MVLLFLAGRCYEAEISTILLLLKYAFAWYPFLPRSNFSVSGRKPWTIVGVLTEIAVIFAALLLLTGRCYGAET